MALKLEVRGIGKDFLIPVVGSVSFGVEPGEFVCLLGPNGCGKTTLLRIVGGIEPASRGQVLLDGQPVIADRRHQRHVGVVFQEDRLLPWLSLRDNVALVLKPLGLTNTANSFTPEIPAPVLHAFTSERREALKIPSGTPFYEESTYWNPSWTITHGAIQTTNVYDMEATAAGIGSGKLLSKESYDTMVSTDLRGKTRAQPGCTTCAATTNGNSTMAHRTIQLRFMEFRSLF